ncbi:MAG: hypothetical protein PF693_09145, partial [Spirochaetia bacterium]|nr:hypothetical protein [Spirochaetia bacterium]
MNNSNIKENLIYSALNGSGAIRIQAALTLSELEFKNSGDYKVISEVCHRLLDDDYTDIVILEYLLDSYFMQEDYENLLITLDRYKSGNTSLKIKYYRFFISLYKSKSISKYYRD